MRAKFLKLDDLREMLGYDSTAPVLEAIKLNKIPYFLLGKPGAIGDKGVAKRLRFIESEVLDWAKKSQVVYEAAAAIGPPPEESRPVRVPASGGWERAIGGTGRRGPNKNRG